MGLSFDYARKPLPVTWLINVAFLDPQQSHSNVSVTDARDIYGSYAGRLVLTLSYNPKSCRRRASGGVSVSAMELCCLITEASCT